MASVSTVDVDRESRIGGAVRDRAGVGAFPWLGLILTVVGTNIALGTFLWLVTDARFRSVEQRLTSMESHFESRFTGIESRFTGIESRFTSIESRLSNIENVLMSGAGAPVAADGEER